MRPRRTTCASAARPPTATARWEALGTTVVLRVTNPLWLRRAGAILARELDAIDRACSRFRPDSDLTRVNAAAGNRPVRASPLLIEALGIALRAAELTDGDVDPTVGAALMLAETGTPAVTGMRAEGECRPASVEGECRPASVEGKCLPASVESECRPASVEGEPLPASAETETPPSLTARLCSGYRTIELNPALGTVRVPRGIVLDLGATAKAWAADRGARAVWARAGCGVLVSIGGDIATAGSAPAGGWRIHVTDDHRSGPDAPGETIAIADGGLATSSVAVRRWRRGGRTTHHIIDPSSGACAQGPWRTVSVAAADCTDANIAATASLVRGVHAPAWLARQGLPARLVAHDGAVMRIGAWPLRPSRRFESSPRPLGDASEEGPLGAPSGSSRGTTPRAHPAVAKPRRADDPQ